MVKPLNYTEIHRNSKIPTKTLIEKIEEELLFKLFLKTYISSIANCYHFFEYLDGRGISRLINQTLS